MSRSIAVPFFVLALFLLSAVLFNPLSGSRFSAENKRLAERKLAEREAQEKRILAELDQASDASQDEPSEPKGPPVAVAVAKDYDFGSMEPYAKAQHIFEIRNDGESTLVLRKGSSSCRCTLNEVVDKYIPPGKTGRVRVEWNTERRETVFHQSANVRTNDPDMPTIKFHIHGEVLVQLGVDPPQLAFPNLAPGQESTQEVLIYSQKFAEFEIGEFTSSISGIRFEKLPADKLALDEHNALSGHRLRVHLPGDLPEGDFSGWLRYEVSGPKSLQAQVDIDGKVLRRLAVYGRGIEADGAISFGALAHGEGARRTFLVKVRDPLPQLEVQQIVANPAWIRAELRPMEDARAEAALYQLVVEVPPDAPAGFYGDQAAASLRISFDHPRIEDLELAIRLIVETSEGV
ncbi:MAG: DUF1573 domain-containing protein [Planctomycetales bacterium]|nr:DUF1573 domain-containing protein [Planctomycetales bacterium]